MSSPRLDIDLGKIRHNARTLVDVLGARGISVTGVTKATLGSPDVAQALLGGGITTLGDSRIENIESMRRAGVGARMVLLRSPMPSQVDRVVKHADVSFNTELDVVQSLSSAAQAGGRTHGVVLMVELGDLREGLLPADLEGAARETVRFPGVTLEGIGTNLACRYGVVPDERNMAELSVLAESIESALGQPLSIVSGGNSANLGWAESTGDTGRVNDLRLGESILLGRETLHRRPLDGLHTDAITLTAEVIESRIKPSLPRGERAQNAFGDMPEPGDRGAITQTILALGRQDTDPEGLVAPAGVRILGASGDHLITDTSPHRHSPGSEVTFELNYSALLQAMTSPFVRETLTGRSRPSAPLGHFAVGAGTL